MATSLLNHQIPNSVSLSALIRSLPGPTPTIIQDLNITSIASDSRSVLPGSLFVACPGETTDGHRFISDAIDRGAVAVVGSQTLSGLWVPYFQFPDSRLALAHLSAAFYGMPARQLVMIGVTGTDGKTTTATLIHQMLQTAGYQSGLVSTLSAQIGSRSLDTGFHVTTPDAPEVQAFLAQMVASGLTYAVLEATSHGLVQQRLAACDFDIGVVTNITHEHLDYHKTYESYREAKGLLFSALSETPAKSIQPSRGAVLNYDDSSYHYLSSITTVAQVSYGLSESADLRAVGIVENESGIQFQLRGKDSRGILIDLPIRTSLVGRHNVHNCLAAIGVGICILGLDSEAVTNGIASLSAIPGRMERIDLGQDFTAIVDFAHTPNALYHALMAARSLTRGRIIAVFGSAGLRDRQKRQLMAEVSASMADLTILTAEDPRTESVDAILAEMSTAMLSKGGIEGQSYWRFPDRREALHFAVQQARPGDLLIACGKGHEQSMCFGLTEYPWDDRIALRAAITQRLGIPGPEMPFLPSP